MNSNFFDLSKKKRRDILSELLVGSSTKGIVSKKELNALNKLIQTVPANRRIVKNVSQPEIKKLSETREKQKVLKKTTCYLSEEIIKKLNKAQNDIQSQVPVEFRSRISKSQLVNQALALMLEEFEAKGKNSNLMRNILR